MIGPLRLANTTSLLNRQLPVNAAKPFALLIDIEQ